jgi:preprotein translocase subunit YajC
VSGEAFLLILLMAMGYLLVVAPARNRRQRATDIREHLKPGVEILTTSGLYARVEQVTEDSMLLEIAPGVVVKYGHSALRRILLPKPQPTSPDKIDNPDKPEDDGPPSPKTL